MKKLSLYILLTVLSTACHKTHTLLVEKTDHQEIESRYNTYDLLSSKWAMIGYSGYFVSGLHPDSIPDYNGNKVLYKMDLNNFELIVTKNLEPHSKDYSLPEGTYRIWVNDCLLKLEDVFYTYEIISTKNQDGVSHRLILDSNYDPGYGADDIVYSFVRIE